MRTAHEIRDEIHEAMTTAMYRVWGELTAEEEAAYRLSMHGIEMAVYEKKPATK